MNINISRSATRRSLGIGLVAGAWLVLSAWSPVVESSAPAVPTEPGRILLAQADAAPVEAPVSYSNEQADRGETNYEKNCVECHGEDLKGGLLGGAPLRGVAFESKYANGAPAGLLYEVMSATMPPNSPGRYSAGTYADLMAYILKRNGFAAG